MQFLGFLVLLFLTYTVGLDSVFGALDSVDQTLRASYDHAVALHPPRVYHNTDPNRSQPEPPVKRHRTPLRGW
jgi:hypothetical protein